MSKNYVNKNRLRRLFSVFMIGAMTLTLTGCSNSYNRYPTGKIDVDAKYASIGNKQVTKGQLWEEFRYASNDILTQKIAEAVLNTYITDIKAIMTGSTSDKKTSYTEKLKKYTIKAIYNVDEEKELDKKTEKQKLLAVEKYLDDLYMNNYEYFNDYIKEGKTTPDVNSIVKELKYEPFYKYYYTNLAKELLAYDKLEETIKENDEKLKDDEDPYFSNSEIVTYYKDNFVNTGDVDAIIIRFMDEDEVNDTFKAFGIKSYKNKLHFVPGKPGASYSEYSKYFDDLSNADITSNKDGIIAFDQVATEAGVLELYIEMYNYVYTYRDSLPNTDPSWTDNNTTKKDRRAITEAIIEGNKDNLELEDIKAKIAKIAAKLDDNKYTNFTSEALKDMNTSLKKYIYENLYVDTTTTTDEDKDEEKTRYSTSGRSYGDYYYLTYKIDAKADEYADAILEDTDGKEYIENADLLTKIQAGLRKDAITDTFITSTYDEAVKEAKISIYDTILEISYAAANTDYSKTLKNEKDKNILAKISYDGTDYFMYVDATFDTLEAKNGTTTAVNILTKEVIKDTTEYAALDKEDEKLYNDNLEYMLSMFANDQLASYGYPSSIGKYNFMLLYYHTADVKNIITDYYKVNAVSNQLINNYENDTLLEQFVSFTNQAKENYLKASATRLLVYVDMNEDGSPDTDFDWSTASNSVTYKKKAQELVDLILTIIEASGDKHATKLAAIVEEYNSSSRFNNGLCSVTNGEYDPTTPECTWAEFRRLGLYVKTDEYADVSNTTAEETIDYALKDRLLKIYNSEDFIIKDTIQSEYIDNEYIETNQGLNLLIVTSAAAASSFEYNLEDFEYAKDYTNIPVMVNDKKVIISDLFSDKDGNVSINQIKLFIYEYSQTNTNQLLPNEIVTALTAFLKPVYERYTASATQNEVMLLFLLKHTNSKDINYTETYNNDRFYQLIEINRKIADSYLAKDDIGNNFAGWWDTLFGKDGQ